MPMVTKFVRVVNIKYNILPLTEDIWTLNEAASDLPWEAPIINVTWSFDHTSMWGWVINWKSYISSFTWLMTIKLGRVLTSGRMFKTYSLKSSPTIKLGRVLTSGRRLRMHSLSRRRLLVLCCCISFILAVFMSLICCLLILLASLRVLFCA